MWRTALSATAAILLSVAAIAAQDGRPGTVNYVEGQVALDGQALSRASIPGAEMAPGQQLVTQNGKAEALLTPGVFLRLDPNSAVKLLQRPADDVRVQVIRGHALLEAAELDGVVQIFAGPMHARLEKPGVYEFSADASTVTAHSGKLRVQANDRTVRVGSGRQLTVSGNAFSEKKLGRSAPDDLYEWSLERSRYEARVSRETSWALVGTNPDTWHGGDWYWNSFLASWAYLPSDCVVTGPMGDRFFSPVYYHDFGGIGERSKGYWELAD